MDQVNNIKTGPVRLGQWKVGKKLSMIHALDNANQPDCGRRIKGDGFIVTDWELVKAYFILKPEGICKRCYKMTEYKIK